MLRDRLCFSGFLWAVAMVVWFQQLAKGAPPREAPSAVVLHGGIPAKLLRLRGGRRRRPICWDPREQDDKFSDHSVVDTCGGELKRGSGWVPSSPLRLRGGAVGKKPTLRRRMRMEWDPRGQTDIFSEESVVDLDDEEFKGVFGWGKTQKDYNLPTEDRQYFLSDSDSGSDQDLTKKFNIAPGDLPDGLGNFPKVSHDPSRWWSNLSVGEGYFFDDDGNWIEDYAGQADDMRRRTPTVDLKLPPWEHTYDSESQDERLFWGLDEPVALAGLNCSSKVVSDPETFVRYMKRARLRTPWRFYPEDPFYTEEVVEELERRLAEKGAKKGSPYFAHVNYNRARRERRKRLIASSKSASRSSTGIVIADSSRAMSTHPTTVFDPCFAACEDWTDDGLGELPHEGALLEGVQPLSLRPGDITGPHDARYVVFDTNMGNMSVELCWRHSPKTCQNFATLAARGYYDGTKFHKLIPGWAVLGGDPTLSGGRGGESIFGEFFPDEIPRTQTGEAVLRHSTAGVVSMSNLGTPHTSASQFFITLNADEGLDGRHNVVGRIVQGARVLALLSLVKVDGDGTPASDLIIERARPSMQAADGDGLRDPTTYHSVQHTHRMLSMFEGRYFHRAPG